MKRCLLAMAILIAVNYGLASADYVVVKIDINQLIHTYEAKPAPVDPNAAVPAVGGFQPPTVMPPNFGKGGKGFKGVRPTLPPPPKLGGPLPGTGPPPPPALINPLYVYAYIETTLPPNNGYIMNQGNPKGGYPFDVWAVDCKLGNQRVKLFLQGMPGELNYWLVKNPSKGFEVKLKEDLKETSEDSKKAKLLALAEGALQRGLMTEFNKCIDELKKLDAKNAIVAAVEKTRASLTKRPEAEDPAAKSLMDDLKKEDYHAVISEQGHYTLLTNIKASTAGDTDLKKKLTRLEEVYSTFFFWHAFKGQSLTPPGYRLAVVLVDSSKDVKEFQTKHAVFNFPPMVGSGFSAQRDNVVVYTARRIEDEAFDNLDLVNQKLWNSNATNGSEVLYNAQALASSRRLGINTVALLQTMALCQKAMADENELYTVSHLGVRQLIAATGMLPRNVQTAEWARAGLASFFEVPPQSFYPCTGGPNWVHFVEFKHWRKDMNIQTKDAKDVLLKVISDEYFRQGYSTLKIALLANKEDRRYLVLQAEEELKVARATSWSLMHYLVHTKNPQLQRFFEEIRGLPRDMDFDSKVLRDCFYRAFGLMMQSPDNPGRQVVDIRKLDALAVAWFGSMDFKGLDSPEYEAQAVKWLDASNYQPRPPLGTIPAAGANPYPGGAFPPGVGKGG